MRTYEIPDLTDTPPDNDEPAAAVRVTCWHCGGDGVYPVSLTGFRRCEACGGTGYTYETTEETEEAENED